MPLEKVMCVVPSDFLSLAERAIKQLPKKTIILKEPESVSLKIIYDLVNLEDKTFDIYPHLEHYYLIDAIEKINIPEEAKKRGFTGSTNFELNGINYRIHEASDYVDRMFFLGENSKQ